jgi:hypothetical protein
LELFRCVGETGIALNANNEEAVLDQWRFLSSGEHDQENDGKQGRG